MYRALSFVIGALVLWPPYGTGLKLLSPNIFGARVLSRYLHYIERRRRDHTGTSVTYELHLDLYRYLLVDLWGLSTRERRSRIEADIREALVDLQTRARQAPKNEQHQIYIFTDLLSDKRAAREGFLEADPPTLLMRILTPFGAFFSLLLIRGWPPYKRRRRRDGKNGASAWRAWKKPLIESDAT
ncbi:hypothetical protein EPN42_01275 [bacterium]|nr:MAG: hypothetical protein EPN42_01275 [bacterium]